MKDAKVEVLRTADMFPDVKVELELPAGKDGYKKVISFECLGYTHAQNLQRELDSCPKIEVS